MKENINYKILYRILRQYSYNRNMEAMNILYKELVLEGVIPEFKFNMEVWKMINRVKCMEMVSRRNFRY